MSSVLDFKLPTALRATEPPEARGLRRDEVRMMVARRLDGSLDNSHFWQLPQFLTPDDLVVFNASATLAAAMEGYGASAHEPVVVHFSSRLSPGGPGPVPVERWVVEPRRPAGGTTRPWSKNERPAEQTRPPAVVHFSSDPGAALHLMAPYRRSPRLWEAIVRLAPGQDVATWLNVHGQAVRYDYVPRPWPLSYYQNVFATEPGSAEMPSAGRPFTPRTIVSLVAKGVPMAPITLHTGVSSLEPGELPYPEQARVGAATARRVNSTRQAGGRVVAVGTTVVRALESAFDVTRGEVAAFDGWTELVVTPTAGVRTVDGLITGWHEPQASHLLMLEAIVGHRLLEKAYATSLAEGYLWHEFGDVALFLP